MNYLLAANEIILHKIIIGTSKFKTTNWVEINDDARERLKLVKLNLKL